MNQGEEEEQFAARLRDQLRGSERQVDAVTRARLSAARARALAPAARPVWLWLVGSGAVAAGVLAALMLPGLQQAQDGADIARYPEAEVLELLADEGSLRESELYDDIELLTWLAETDERA